MATVVDFDDAMCTKLTGVPRTLRLTLLAKALKEFCTQSRFWRIDLQLLPVAGFLDVDLPEHTFLVEVERISQNGEPLTEGKDYRPHRGNKIEMLISTDGLLDVEVSIAPKNKNAEVGDDILAEFDDVIACGAAAIAFKMPRQAWTNPQYGQDEQNNFTQGVSDAKTKALARGEQLRGGQIKYTFY